MMESHPDREDALSGVEIIRRALVQMPSSSGVYRMLGEQDQVLYIGKARQLKNRVASYANLAQLPLRLQRMVMATRRLDITLTASEAEALLLEANLIKMLKPHYNILLKDDKSYPYIHLSDHLYPRISKYRGAKEGPGQYFGPFVSAAAVDETITLLQKAFLLRPCPDTVFKNRARPCLQYQIKRCSAPCVRNVSEEQYAGLIAQARQFLSGNRRDIQEALASEMQAASEHMDYEHAALLRDRIRALTQVQQQASVAAAGLESADVIALAREGPVACIQVFCFRCGSNYGNRAFFPAHVDDRADAEVLSAFIGQFYQRQAVPSEVLVSHALPDADVLAKALSLLAKCKVELAAPQRGNKKTVMEQALRNAKEALNRHLLEGMQQKGLLRSISETFGLEDMPERIEVYDNSHVMGAHAVGAMIVAGPDGFDRKAYRLFNIRSETLTPGDDYAMLREVLTRRFGRLGSPDTESWHKPDLVLIDGGAGQLGVARGVLEQFGIGDVAIAAIAKGPDRNAGREWLHFIDRPPMQLAKNDPVLHYLQRLRDEAHRFAIGAHRNRRSKAATLSELDAIASIGPARKKALLHHFGSARSVAAASIQDIEKAPGISRELARKIYGHFHG